MALKKAEHHPMMVQQFPEWAEKIQYWHVDDLDCATADETLPMAARRASSSWCRRSPSSRPIRPACAGRRNVGRGLLLQSLVRSVAEPELFPFACRRKGTPPSACRLRFSPVRRSCPCAIRRRTGGTWIRRRHTTSAPLRRVHFERTPTCDLGFCHFRSPIFQGSRRSCR